MKGISMKGNSNLFSTKSLPLYRNPILDFCSILQYGSEDLFCTLSDMRSIMIRLANNQKGVVGKRSKSKDHLTICVTFDQSLFKRKLSHVLTDEFIMSIPIKKKKQELHNQRDILGLT